MGLTRTELEAILQFSIALGREAGKLILEGSDAILRSAAGSVEEKKNSVDLVTKYDKAVEDLVKQRMKEAYPMFGLWVKSDWIPFPTEVTEVLTVLVKKKRLRRASCLSLQMVLSSVLTLSV